MLTHGSLFITNPLKSLTMDNSPNGLQDCVRLDRSVLQPLIVGAVLRLILMLATWLRTGTRIMTQGDSLTYLEPGRNLLLHGVYSSHGQVELDRTPGYSIFVALTGAAFGNVLLTIAFQIVLACITLLLIRRIAALTFPHRSAGTIAAWLFALEPVSIASSVRIMPETLFVLLITVVIERLLTFRKTASLKTLSLSGLSLAAATYVRPVSYYLVFPLAIALLFAYRRNQQLRWQVPAILLAATLPFLAVWQLRNAYETGYTGFSSIVEKNLYYFQSAEVTAELSGIPLATEQIRLGYTDEASYLAIHPEQQNWTQAQRLSFMRKASATILSQHPARYLKTHFIGVSLVAFTPAATEFLQLVNLYPPPQSMPRRILNEGLFASAYKAFHAHKAVILCMVYFEAFLLFLYVFANWGDFFGSGSRFAILTLAGFAMYFLLVSGGAQAVGRYRMPLIPELCVLAGGGLAAATKRKRAESEDPALPHVLNSA